MEAMTVSQLAKFAGHKLKGAKRILGFSVDSRTVKSGDVFFALPGEQVDGHAYLSEVAKKGAVAAVVSKSYSGEDFGLPLIVTDDVLRLLQDLAKHRLAKQNPRIVAVTGSIGKTTTKEFIKTLLSQKYKVGATPGNYNSQIGIPLAVLNHTDGTEEILVVEMGMTHPGQIAKLVQIAPPDVAVITQVDLVHACNFEGKDVSEVLFKIGSAKAEIFSHPKTQLGILNREILHVADLFKMGSCPKISYSTSSSYADFSLKALKEKIKIKSRDGEVSLRHLSIPGKHHQQNFLAAVAVARHFNLDWKEIEEGIEKLALPERRFQRIEKNGIVFVNDSYNACTASTKAALQSLPKPGPKGRKIAVLGEMRELGKFSEKCHIEVGECALECVEKVFCLGKEIEPLWNLWKQAQKPVEWTLDRSVLVDMLRKYLLPGDVVLLKGSSINCLWKVLDEL